MTMFSQLFRLSSHSVIYSLSYAVSQLVGFFLLPVYTRYFSPNDYGILEVLQVTMAFGAIFYVLGLSTALFKWYFQYDDEEHRQKIINTIFIFVTASSLIFTLILVALSETFSSLFFDSTEYTTHFRLVFITLFFLAGTMIELSVLRAREQPVRYALVSTTQFVLNMVFIIIFVVGLERGVKGAIEGNLIAAGLVYFGLTISLMQRSGISFDRKRLFEMLAFGLPLVPSGIASIILTMSDRYLLQFLSTTDEVGLYSLGYKLGFVVNVIIVQPFTLAWAPFVFSMAKENNAAQIYSRVLTYVMAVGVFFALALAMLSLEFVNIMATPPFYGAHKVVPLIALSYVFYGAYFAMLVGILLEAKTKYIMLIVSCVAALNVGLNYILIPHYGMMGAAIATLICYAIMPIGAFVFARKFFKVDYEWLRIGKILVVGGIIYSGSLFISNESAYVAGLFKLLALLTYPILLYLFRFYRDDEINKAKDMIRIASGYLKSRING